jgi:hypothetical protein
MHIGWDRTVDKILFINIDIHIGHSPINLLCMNLADPFPIVWVHCIEKCDVWLARAIIQIAFRSKPSSVNSCIRNPMFRVQLCWYHFAEDLRSSLTKFSRGGNNQICFSWLQQGIKKGIIVPIFSQFRLLSEKCQVFLDFCAFWLLLCCLRNLLFDFLLVHLHLIFSVDLIVQWGGLALFRVHHLHYILIIKSFFWIGLEIPIWIIRPENALLSME